jgi:hypothetical protein
MARQQAAPDDAASSPARRGRPPGAPRTTLARWLRDRDLRVIDLTDRMTEIAAEIGIDPKHVPLPNTLRDTVNGRSCPSAPVMLLIRHVTSGAIDLEHWVRDLYSPDR